MDDSGARRPIYTVWHRNHPQVIQLLKEKGECEQVEQGFRLEECGRGTGSRPPTSSYTTGTSKDVQWIIELVLADSPIGEKTA